MRAFNDPSYVHTRGDSPAEEQPAFNFQPIHQIVRGVIHLEVVEGTP